MRQPDKPIQSREDLEDYIYYAVGLISMEEVRELLDVIAAHKDLIGDM